MKTLTKTLLCVCGLTLVSLALNAANEQASGPKEYQLPKYTVGEITVLPEPTHNPIPAISAQYAGMSLKLKLTVNEKGRPENVRLEKPLFNYSNVHIMSFASQMKDKVKNWKFEPAQDANGQPVAVKVRLPVIVVEKAGSLTVLATLMLDDRTEDRS